MPAQIGGGWSQGPGANRVGFREPLQPGPISYTGGRGEGNVNVYQGPAPKPEQAAPAQAAPPQSFVMPTYGGWSNLDPGARGRRLQQTGEMSFQGQATDAARNALDNSLGGATRPAVGNTVGGPAGDPIIAEPAAAAPGPSQPRQRFTQQPGMQMTQQKQRPLVEPTLWRMSQGRI